MTLRCLQPSLVEMRENEGKPHPLELNNESGRLQELGCKIQDDSVQLTYYMSIQMTYSKSTLKCAGVSLIRKINRV